MKQAPSPPTYRLPIGKSCTVSCRNMSNFKSAIKRQSIMKESVVIQSRNTFQNLHLSFMQCRTLPPLHGHAAPGPGLFFFMIVWLMAKSNPQLLELLHPLAVDVQPRLCSHGSRIVLEDIAHVAE